jgi:Tfp pilus assembly protein FimV
MIIAHRVMKTCWLTIAMLCFGLGVAPAHAASLGDIDVKSGLYEPFHARIALRGLREGELEGMRVSLADEAAFVRAGLVRSLALSKLKFEVMATGAHGGFVKITTRERVREPSLSFVVEAAFEGASGTLQRRYDVLLDLD